MRVTPFLIALIMGCSAFAQADDSEQAIRKTLQALQPDMAVESVSKSPIAGLYQVALRGGRQIYATADGQYLLQGYLYQYKEGQVANLTEQAQAASVVKTIAAIPDQDMVVFASKSLRPASRFLPMPIALTAKSCMKM